MCKSLVIHFNNVFNIGAFDKSVFFNLNEQLDRYIHYDILKKLEEVNFDILYIKDNLSKNYLELYGVYLAYHIRLSEKLKEKRFVPIVILSDFDGYTLNKISSLARIFFSSNIFIAPNNKISLRYCNTLKGKKRVFRFDEKHFLETITIKPPIESQHNIANEWAIDRWSNVLGLEIAQNREKIQSNLYFKYLVAQYKVVKNEKIEHLRPQGSGRVLFIDDEWNRGWGEILKKLFDSDVIAFEIWEKPFNEKENIKSFFYEERKEPQVVILDLRLFENDRETLRDIDDYGGVQFLKNIKRFNPGIQVILFSATSSSRILNRLYDYGILGYVKKEHPKEIDISTIANMNELVQLVDRGLEKKYLIEIWNKQQKILKYNFKDIQKSVETFFYIFSSDSPKPFIRGFLNIFQCFEHICNTYIYTQYDYKLQVAIAYWKNSPNTKILNEGNASMNNRLKALFSTLKIEDKDNEIDILTASRNYHIHTGSKNEKAVESPTQEHILEWLDMLIRVLEAVS